MFGYGLWWEIMDGNNLFLDDDGEALIKKFEGLSLTPYQDEHGIWTIGFGHIKGVDENSPPISILEAERLFEADLNPTEKAVNKYVSVPLNQNEFNALVSFSFNEGIGRLLSSTLIKKINYGDRQGAAREFERWVWYKDQTTNEMKKSNGLIERRELERVLFLTPVMV